MEVESNLALKNVRCISRVWMIDGNVSLSTHAESAQEGEVTLTSGHRDFDSRLVSFVLQLCLSFSRATLHDSSLCRHVFWFSGCLLLYLFPIAIVGSSKFSE